MNGAALTVTNVSIGYKEGKATVNVVDSIDASLCCGELVVLIGKNGAGKSTLLRTLSGFQKPLSGEIRYSGKDAGELSLNELAKEVAVVLTANEPVSLNVREVVSLGRTPYTNFMGVLTANDKKAVESAMNAMGIGGLEKRTVATLSDGERQKCMIAKALAQDTPLMFLDEPTAFLDFTSKVKLLRMLKQLAREGNKAVLVSTHDIELAIRLADKIWLLSEGNFCEGSVDELSDNGVLHDFISDAGAVYDKTERKIEIL